MTGDIDDIIHPAHHENITFLVNVARIAGGVVTGIFLVIGFPAPLFCDDFDVEQQRVLKEKHLKLRLRKGNSRIDAIQFNFATQPGHRARAAYRLAINEYMGVESPQLMIEHLD